MPSAASSPCSRRTTVAAPAQRMVGAARELVDGGPLCWYTVLSDWCFHASRPRVHVVAVPLVCALWMLSPCGKPGGAGVGAPAASDDGGAGGATGPKL